MKEYPIVRVVIKKESVYVYFQYHLELRLAEVSLESIKLVKNGSDSYIRVNESDTTEFASYVNEVIVSPNLLTF